MVNPKPHDPTCNEIAKLFNIPEPCVLVKTNHPSLQFTVEWEDILITTELKFSDTDEGYELRDRGFDAWDEEASKKYLTALVMELP